MTAVDITRVRIADLRRDGGTQPREEINTQVATEYGEAMALGAKFPPVIVFHDGQHRWLAGGFHRVYGAEITGATEIDAEVRQGTLRDAILFSLGENATHGLRRTNSDKRRAIARFFEDPEWRKWSDRQIARHLHVDGKTVAAMRPRDTAEFRSERTYVDRHGNTSSMDVTNIANRPAAAAPSAGDVAAPPPPPVKGSRQLRTLLGELRAGTNIESAAIVAGIPIVEAREHAAAEQRGEYRDVVAIEPALVIESDVPVTPSREPANDVQPIEVEPQLAAAPPAFDFAVARSREVVMQAITALAIGREHAVGAMREIVDAAAQRMVN